MPSPTRSVLQGVYDIDQGEFALWHNEPMGKADGETQTYAVTIRAYSASTYTVAATSPEAAYEKAVRSMALGNLDADDQAEVRPDGATELLEIDPFDPDDVEVASGVEL